MKTKEILTEIENIRLKSIDLNKIIDNAVYKYLDEKIGIKSANSEASDDLIGMAVAEECGWHWDREMNLITITYCVFRNKWGDFSEDKKINVDFSILDKYINDKL